MKSISVFNFSAKNASDKKTCDVYIDGIILDESSRQLYEDWFGDTTSVSYKSLRTTLQNAVSEGCKTINLYVNSCGGNVIEAMALHDYFAELEMKGITINRIGRGIIASAATYFLVGKNSSITKNSWYMIHNCSGYAWGDVNDVENMAKTLRKFNDSIVEFYCNNTGMTKEEIGKMMDAETWMTGKDAVDMKFVHECTPETDFTNAIDPKTWMFNNKAVVSAYNSFTNKNPIMDKTTISNIVNGVKDAFMNALKEAGIIKNENTQMCETITAALDKALEPMNEGINTAITEEVTNQIAALDIKALVTEAIKNVTPEAAAPVDLTEIEGRLTEIENAIADDANSATPKKKKDEKVTAENHPGITFE